MHLPQAGLRGGGLASGQGAAAQVGQRVGLIPGAADLAGQVQGLPVTRPQINVPACHVSGC